jgi:hypothetical protein
MTWRLEILTGAGVGARAASTVYIAASPRRRVRRCATDDLQRVRALWRATRSATRLSMGTSGQTELAAGLSLHGGRHSRVARRRIGSCGPGLLTEDRQKAGARL